MMLVGVEQWTTSDEAIAAGWTEIAKAYFAPDGILLRMRLGCFNVWDRGDPFKDEADTKWWRSTYKFASALYGILGVYLKFDLQRRDQSNPDDKPVWVTDTAIADGDPGAIAHERAGVEERDFPVFMASKCEPPWFIPGALTNYVPVPNTRCTLKPQPGTDKVARIFDGIPLWVWALALYVLLDGRKGHR